MFRFGHVFVPNGMCYIHLRIRSLQGVIVSQAPCECGLLAGRSWEDKGVTFGENQIGLFQIVWDVYGIGGTSSPSVIVHHVPYK